MMRLARLALIMASTLTLASTALAQQEMTVEEITNQISTLESDFENFSGTVNQLQQEERELREKLQSLRERNNELEQKRESALAEMNDRYQRLVEDPTIDIACLYAS